MSERCSPSGLVLAVLCMVVVGPVLVSRAETPAQTPAAETTGQTLSDEALSDLFDRGEWAWVVFAGREAGTVTGLVLSVRATLVLNGYDKSFEEQEAALEQAIEDIERAVAIDPDNEQALLQKAAAYGYRGRLLRNMGDGRTSRDLLEKVLADHPDDAWAVAAMGGWHGEVIIAIGSFMGGILFGAKRDEAVELLTRAVELDPTSIPVRLLAGKILMRFNKDGLVEQGAVHLKAISGLTPVTALDRLMVDQAARFLEASALANKKEREAAIAQLIAYNPEVSRDR